MIWRAADTGSAIAASSTRFSSWPLVNMTAGGMSGFDAETNNRTVYYDDIEFLE